MKNSVLIIILFTLVFGACKKDKTKACVYTEPSNPYVGQSVKVVNCSENFKQSFVNFNDGTQQVLMNNTFTKTFFFAKTYTISIESFSADLNDVEKVKSTFEVNVRSPEKKDLIGQWKGYRFVGFDETFPAINEELFDSKIVEINDLNIEVIFKENKELSIRDLKGTYTDTTQWYFTEPGKLQMDTFLTEVVTFHKDSLILLTPYRFGFSLNYYSRVR